MESLLRLTHFCGWTLTVAAASFCSLRLLALERTSRHMLGLSNAVVDCFTLSSASERGKSGKAEGGGGRDDAAGHVKCATRRTKLLQLRKHTARRWLEAWAVPFLYSITITAESRILCQARPLFVRLCQADAAAIRSMRRWAVLGRFLFSGRFARVRLQKCCAHLGSSDNI